MIGAEWGGWGRSCCAERVCGGRGHAAQDREDGQQDVEDLIKSDCNMIDSEENYPLCRRGRGRKVMHVPLASVWRIVYDRRAEENLKG